MYRTELICIPDSEKEARQNAALTFNPWKADYKEDIINDRINALKELSKYPIRQDTIPFLKSIADYFDDGPCYKTTVIGDLARKMLKSVGL